MLAPRRNPAQPGLRNKVALRTDSALPLPGKPLDARRRVLVPLLPSDLHAPNEDPSGEARGNCGGTYSRHLRASLCSLAVTLPDLSGHSTAGVFRVRLSIDVRAAQRNPPPSWMNVPLRSSRIACCSSALVFITIGPYHATGSSIGRPDTSRKRMPSSPA